MQLRPYQTQLVTEIRGQYQLGRKAVLAVLPTGGGKTVCFSYIAQAASIKGNRVLILVHRAELLDQASRAMPVPHGIIAAGRAMDLSHTVQVASVQTVARRLHLLPRDFFQLLVVDEAHHTTAGTWAKVIAHFACRQAARRHGYANHAVTAAAWVSTTRRWCRGLQRNSSRMTDSSPRPRCWRRLGSTQRRPA
jgi:superfamily II DNA or RNA helicase